MNLVPKDKSREKNLENVIKVYRWGLKGRFMKYASVRAQDQLKVME